MTASKRNKIIQVAKDRFIKKGFANTSMDEISRLAKVSKGGLYHHFSTKNEILMAIFVENQENVRKKGPELFQKKEKIISDLGKFYDSLDLQRNLMSIWFQALSDTKNNSEFQRMMLERRQYLEGVTLLQFQEFQSLGFLQNYERKDLSKLAKGSLALIKGCALDTLTGDDDKVVKKAWISTMHAILVSKK